jgi:desulfoferrodoxin-like iron-binding protein
LKINKPLNPYALSELEKKHLPHIEISEETVKREAVEVKVSVGRISHPATENHYIKWIRLYNREKLVGYMEIGPFKKPQVNFFLKNPKSIHLVAQASCNIHGVWESRHDISFINKKIRGLE